MVAGTITTLALSRGQGVVQGQGTGPTYDPDAIILFARASTPPDAARKQLISNQFVAGKAKSFWAKLDILYVHAAHEAMFGRMNWLSASYDCVPVNTPAFTVDQGFLPDGVSSYLSTNFNPATAPSPKHVQNSASFGIRSNTNNSAAGSLAGFYDGTKGTTINPNNGGGATFRVNSSGFGGGTNANSIGLYTVNRVDASNIQMFKDGVSIGTSAQASSATANGPLRFGSIADNSFRACQFSMGFAGSGMTAQEVADVSTWFDAYRAAIGLA